MWFTNNLLFFNFTWAYNHFKDKFWPFLKNYTAENPRTKIVLYKAAEYHSPERKHHYHNWVRNKYIRKFNQLIDETIPNSGYGDKIFKISANLEALKSPTGSYLLPDGCHLAEKKVGNIVIAPTIMLNINLMLNLVCNRFESDASLCCQHS